MLFTFPNYAHSHTHYSGISIHYSIQFPSAPEFINIPVYLDCLMFPLIVLLESIYCIYSLTVLLKGINSINLYLSSMQALCWHNRYYY